MIFASQGKFAALHGVVRRLSVFVKPKSSVQSVTELEDGRLEVRLHSPPADGRANAELIQMVARHLGVKKRDVHIVTGESSHHKIIEIRTAGL